MSIFLQPALVTAMAVGVILAGGALDIDHAWPVLLAAAVGLAAGPARPGRIAAYVAGAMIAWVGAAIGAAALPQIAGAQALVVAGAITVLAGVGAASRGRMPLWAGLAGYAAFAALYQPLYAARPTAFLTESPAALQTILLAGALGFLAALLADLAPARRQATATAAASADATVPLWSGAVTAPPPAPAPAAVPVAVPAAVPAAVPVAVPVATPVTAAAAAAAAAADPIQVVIDLTSGGEIAPEPADHAPPARRAPAKREKV